MMREEGEQPVKTVKASTVSHLTDPSEKQFQGEVIKVAKMLGWAVFFTWDSHHSPSGEPDLRLVHPGKKKILWRELKVGKNKLSPHQHSAHMVLMIADQDVAVWYPSDWDQIIKELS